MEYRRSGIVFVWSREHGNSHTPTHLFPTNPHRCCTVYTPLLLVPQWSHHALIISPFQRPPYHPRNPPKTKSKTFEKWHPHLLKEKWPPNLLTKPRFLDMLGNPSGQWLAEKLMSSWRTVASVCKIYGIWQSGLRLQSIGTCMYTFAKVFLPI